MRPTDSPVGRAVGFPVGYPGFLGRGGATPIFILRASLLSDALLSVGVGSYTFARADTNATVTDFEGLVKDVTANEARFPGARRVENVLNANQVSGTASTVDNGDGTFTTTGLTTVNANRLNLRADANFGEEYIGTIDVKADIPANIGKQIRTQLFSVTGSGGTKYVHTLTADYQRIVTYSHVHDGNNTEYEWVYGNNTNNATGITWRRAQVESITGQAITAPSEYVEDGTVIAGVDYGTNVDSVRYFTTENGNTVSGNVVTEAQGADIADATLQGGLVEGTRTNYANTDDDLTGGAETINITAGGTGNYTLSVYGTAAVTVAAGTATGSGFAQATEGSPVTFNITVVGTITLTLDSGALDTNQPGDYLKQVEVGSFATTFIPSPTTVTATRNAESLSYLNTNILDDEGTLAIVFTPNGSTAQYAGNGDRALIGVRGVNNDLLHIDTTTGKLILSDGTNETVPTTLPDLVAGTATKIAIRWSATAGTMQIRQDGVEVSATFDGSMNKSTALRIGYSGANRANGSYKQLSVYDSAVSDTTFTGLTS